MVVLLALLVSGAAIHLATREPSYQGRGLSSWMRDLAPDDDIGSSDVASEAICQIGTNALPYILSELRRKDSPGKSKLMQWNTKLEERLDHELIKFRPAFERRATAVAAIAALGTNAAPAIAEISRNLGDRELLDVSAQSLALIGRPALPAIKELARSTNDLTRFGCAVTLHWFTNTDEVAPTLQLLATDSQPEVRARAALCLGNSLGAPASNVPVLIQLLNDTEKFVQESACHSLGNFSNSAAVIVPALSNVLVAASQNGGSLRVSAGRSLRRMGPASLPIFLGLLAHPDGQLRADAVRYVGSFRDEATNHVAELLPLLHDRDPRVRNSALLTFRRIPVDPARFMPALVEALKLETDENTRGHFFIALQQFGEAATNALPVLIEQTHDATGDSRMALMLTIAAIDEEAAKKLGADATMIEMGQASREHLQESFGGASRTNSAPSAPRRSMIDPPPPP